jgi:tetratricopeptide (TPR) repeat protein
VLLLAVPLHAQAQDARLEAKQAYVEGTRQYDVGEYAKALANFKKAYLLYEEPAFLFNMALCYRQLGQKRDAVGAYKSYLRKVYDVPNRAEVQRIIATLEAEIASEPARSAAPPEPQPSPPTKTAAAPAAPAPALVEVKHAAPRPLHKRWWLWTGVAVVAAGVGVGLGLGLSHQSFNATLPEFGPGRQTSGIRF